MKLYYVSELTLGTWDCDCHTPKTIGYFKHKKDAESCRDYLHEFDHQMWVVSEEEINIYDTLPAKYDMSKLGAQQVYELTEKYYPTNKEKLFKLLGTNEKQLTNYLKVLKDTGWRPKYK